MKRPGGYVGRILNVDLTTGLWEEQRLDDTMARSFIGGYGLGARIIFERMPPGVDALSADGVLGFVTGPLTGTPAILGPRYAVVGKSPLTGGWGDANSGGKFGPTMKFAGYDAIFVTGISPHPVYLSIDNGQPSLNRADDLWGLDTRATTDILEARHGKGASVACIGPAGERLTRIAGIINDGGRAAARSGLGALMGSKRLKAIVVRGSGSPPVANLERVRAIRQRCLPLFKTGPTAAVLRDFGTAGVFSSLIGIGRTPIKNFRGSYPTDFPNPDALDGPAVIAHQVRRHGCWQCVQACSGIVRWEEGGKTVKGHKPEYETLASFGSYLQVDDLRVVMMMNERCNQAGLDTISAGAVIAFAMECYENGLFTENELEGLQLKWGDGDAALDLLDRVIARRGLGELLADGVWRASQKLGRGSERFAMHCGGQELPAHDPRQSADLGLAYQISPTPGRHTQGGTGVADLSSDECELYGIDSSMKTREPVLFQALAYARENGFNNVVNAAGLCTFGPVTMGRRYVPEIVSAITGWDFDMAECLEAGERIEMMRYLFCLREGYNPLRVEVSPRALGHPPLEDGPTAGVSVDLEHLRSAYLTVIEIDPVTGDPNPARLASLGLDRLPVQSAESAEYLRIGKAP